MNSGMDLDASQSFSMDCGSSVGKDMGLNMDIKLDWSMGCDISMEPGMGPAQE